MFVAAITRCTGEPATPAFEFDQNLVHLCLTNQTTLLVSKNPPRSSIISLSPAKRRAFYAVTIFFPFVFIVLAEVLLRLFHVGPDLSLITTQRWSGKDYYVLNGDVKGRYFPTFQFNPSVSPDYFPVIKEPGTYRIFCLGGSTTVGYPYWYNGAFSSFLRDRLQATFPDRRIEVINMGMTATNSFTVVDMARDLFPYEPDLFIVYDGHNEFYGALGIASNESLGRTLWITKAYLKLVPFRMFALLKDVYGNVRQMLASSESGHYAGTLMESLARGQYVPYGSRTYWDGLSIFKSNLEELKTLCSERHVPLIVSSQVSNVRDQGPFVSAHSAGLTPQLRQTFEEVMRKGLVDLGSARVDSALLHFRLAASSDSMYAEAHFRMGQCLDTLGRYAEARQEYLRARDYDQLRFRTSTEFNDAIRTIADGRQVIFADMERVFNQNSPDSITGKDLLFEHLHPRARGYFLMADEYARLMKERGLLADADEWQRGGVSNDQLWNERNMTELDERGALRRTKELISGWPFRSQTATVEAPAPDDTLGQITEEVAKGRWDWKQAHEAAANYYLLRRDHENAAREYRVIINQLPMVDVQLYLKLAKILLDQNKMNELRDVLLASLSLQPTMLAYRALGDIALRQGRPQEAVTHYEKLLAFPQSNSEEVENGYFLALSYSQSGQREKAVNRLSQILRIKPDDKPAKELLSRINNTR